MTRETNDAPLACVVEERNGVRVQSCFAYVLVPAEA